MSTDKGIKLSEFVIEELQEPVIKKKHPQKNLRV